jgi:hypothetical protein
MATPWAGGLAMEQVGPVMEPRDSFQIQPRQMAGKLSSRDAEQAGGPTLVASTLLIDATHVPPDGRFQGEIVRGLFRLFRNRRILRCYVA